MSWETGIHKRMPLSDYLALPHLSRSDLLCLADRDNPPAEFYWRMQNDRTETDAMRLGSALHCAVLEPEDFEERFTTYPLPVNNSLKPITDLAIGKAVASKGLAALTPGKQAEYERALQARHGVLTKVQAESFVADMAAQGKTVLKDASTITRTLATAELIRSKKGIKRLLEAGAAETTYLWVDEQTGVPLKCRPDLDSPMVFDLKRTAQWGRRAFDRKIDEFGLDLQGAMNREARLAHGLEWEAHVLGWVYAEEGKRTRVEAQQLSGTWLEKGEIILRRACRIYAECAAKKEWPAEPLGITQPRTPYWVEKSVEEELELEAAEGMNA